MKKITLALVALSVLVLPVMVSAVAALPAGVPAVGSMEDLINKIGSFMWVIFGGIAVVMFVIAGILFLTAGGDPEKVASARQSFIWGIAGVVVAILAYSILTILTNFF